MSARPTDVPNTGSSPLRGEHTRLHVAVVDEEFPYPLDSGKRIRTLNLLLPLARRHRITYLAYPNVKAEETRAAIEYLNAQGIETVVVDGRLPGKGGLAFYWRLAANLVSPLPYSVQVHNQPSLPAAIRKFAAANAVDLWHCEWTPYAQSVGQALGGPWVVMAHNIESLIWQRYAENESHPLKRWYIRRQWRKYQRFEREAFARTRRLITVSDADADLAVREFGAPRVGVVENGVDPQYFHPHDTRRDPDQMLFLGSLDWRPNQDAVRLLLERIFPAVRERHPQARLAIAGRRPPTWLVEQARPQAGVTLHADLADVRPLLWGCGVMAVPLRVGGGSRLKILEALATQCPVVSTRVGAEGLCLEPGRHFVQVETVDQMAYALVSALQNPQPHRAMAVAGAGRVAERYHWPILADKLESIWREQALCR